MLIIISSLGSCTFAFQKRQHLIALEHDFDINFILSAILLQIYVLLVLTV